MEDQRRVEAPRAQTALDDRSHLALEQNMETTKDSVAFLKTLA